MTLTQSVTSSLQAIPAPQCLPRPRPRDNKEIKNKGDKISRVMGSGHSSSFLLSASAERMAGKITEVANFDFREETLDSGKM